MMINELTGFIKAEDLKSKFQVSGAFYSVSLGQGKTLKCRSVLEIRGKQFKDIGSAPDAIVIMMNPGSSKPLPKNPDSSRLLDEDEIFITEDAISQMKPKLVPTKPDKTQYQVMRIMLICGWNYVRVLNLSDLREPKSNEFFKEFHRLEKDFGFDAHSIFSLDRSVELKRMMDRKPGALVVCAWGVNDHLDPLIERCLKRLAGVPKLAGLLKPNTLNKYYHPFKRGSVRQLEWVNDLVAELGR